MIRYYRYRPYALKHKLDSSGYCAECDITYTYDASRLTGYEKEDRKHVRGIKVMQQIVDVLKSLDIKAQRRALRWACERYEPWKGYEG